MRTFDEVRDFLEETFGTDYAHGASERNEQGHLIVPLVRKSDGSYLGYMAAMMDQANEEGNPGGPYLEVKVYLDMGVCLDYFGKRAL